MPKQAEGPNHTPYETLVCRLIRVDFETGLMVATDEKGRVRRLYAPPELLRSAFDQGIALGDEIGIALEFGWVIAIGPAESYR